MFCLMLFTSVLQSVEWSPDGYGGRWGATEGLYHLHLADNAFLPNNFLIRLIDNLHILDTTCHTTKDGSRIVRLRRSATFDEWMNSDENKISEEHERRGRGGSVNPTTQREGARVKDRGRERERGGGGGKKKDSLSAVFCQGRNYTFTEVFSGNDGFHRSNHWIYEPIFNMKYRHRESILPMFTFPSPTFSLSVKWPAERGRAFQFYLGRRRRSCK